MDISWDDVKLFLAVVEGGSLSGAARRLRMTQPTVSRRIAELEARLTEPLFLRGGGGTALTPYGEGLVEPARRMAESAGELTRAAERSSARPHGIVRVTAAPGVAYDFVTPFAAWLRAELPDVRLELISTLHYVDLVRREADLALRMRPPSQKELVTLAELTTNVAAFASRRYANKLPRRYGVSDVDWIGWAPPFENLSPNRELTAIVPSFQPAFASDDFIIQIRAAQEGLGAIVLPKVEHRFRRDDQLVELDVDLRPHCGHLYLVAAKSALAIPRVRAVADLLAAELQKIKPPKKGR